MAKLQLAGLDELRAKLKENANLDDVKDVVRLNTSEMHEKAVRDAPHDTGHLERSIEFDASLDNGFSGKIASTAEYASYQEYGTRYQYGTAHVRPAFYTQRWKFLKDMGRLMD